jgi:hypothetical protein
MRPRSVVLLGVINHTLEYDMERFWSHYGFSLIATVMVCLTILNFDSDAAYGYMLLACIALAAQLSLLVTSWVANHD